MPTAGIGCIVEDMALRKGHGTGAGKLRIENLPPDEQPDGMADLSRPGPQEGRGADGRFMPANPLARLGGKARQNYAKMSVKIVSNGMENVSPGLQIYMRRAEKFRRVTCREYARDVGGGYCGAAVSMLVLKAAQAFAWSQYFHDMATSGGGDIDLISKETRLAEMGKGFLTMAYELCARQGKSRPPSQTEMQPWQKKVVEEVVDPPRVDEMLESSTLDAEGANDMQSVQPTEDDETGEDES